MPDTIPRPIVHRVTIDSGQEKRSAVTIDLPAARLAFEPTLDVSFSFADGELDYFKAAAGGDREDSEDPGRNKTKDRFP